MGLKYLMKVCLIKELFTEAQASKWELFTTGRPHIIGCVKFKLLMILNPDQLMRSTVRDTLEDAITSDYNQVQLHLVIDLTR